jgi:hypothetical protein
MWELEASIGASCIGVLFARLLEVVHAESHDGAEDCHSGSALEEL